MKYKIIRQTHGKWWDVYLLNEFIRRFNLKREAVKWILEQEREEKNK
jgi:hypothetical protein